MTVHRFVPSVYHNTIGSHDPILRVRSGDTIETTSVDAAGMDIRGDQVARRSNPMTGPFYIEGAEPGDMLAVRFERIYPNRDWGWAANLIAPNVLDPDFVPTLPGKETVRWTVDLEAGTARLADSAPSLAYLHVELAPFLGCFGVAPANGQAISTATSGEYGGNMDYKGFVEGVTAYFPVFAEGALLHVGDGHAVQGDGEITGNGIEISMDIRFTVEVIKGKTTRWPRGDSGTHLFTVGNARPLDQAVQHATTEMVRWLGDDYGLSTTEASILLSQCVEYELGNIFDPAYTMVCKLNKRFLPKMPA
ncbi:acetamidase/formamidase family protein [Paenibacillus humicola]|uniref:acetamidase/formamidase family protein n=1 Tax=Paenibacillus humicola TaxID=3110540 RepID=UPI00237BF54B|nr:acetamidase/formamidase family protein [Paenibacillus humicola]